MATQTKKNSSRRHEARSSRSAMRRTKRHRRRCLRALAASSSRTTRPSRSAIVTSATRRQLRIVRHEHQRRLARAVDVEQQLDDLVAGGAVEIAGRLVGEQDRRIVRQRARDRDALLLAARELRRIVMAALGRARPPRAAPSRAPRGLRHAGDLHRHQDVLERGQRRQQVEELEDEADARAAQPRQRVLVERGDVDAVDARCCPVDGASRPAIRPSSVDLPLPDGPVIATTRAALDRQVERMQDGEGAGAARHRLGDAAQLDHEAADI